MASEIEVMGDTFFDDPYALYKRWHKQGSVHQVRFRDGGHSWVVTGYAEGRAALAHPKLHKASTGATALVLEQFGRVSAEGGLLSSSMLNSDPPDHTRLRGLVNKAFTARSIESLRPRIEEITTNLLDGIAAHSNADLIEDFAVPLPITVICELLGVPFEDRSDFRAWTDILLTVSTQENRTRAAQSMAQYLYDLIEAKRTHQEDDLLTALVHARDDDDQLTEKELVSTAFLLLVAGHETTVNLIGNGAYALLRDRDQFDALVADPSLVTGAVEEFLRYDGPINLSTMRYTSEPILIGDTEIPANEFVYVALGSANRDAEKYENPDTLDVTRSAAGHVAFGYGIHYCVGAPLARMEAQIAFTQLVQRFPKLRLAPTPEPMNYRESHLIRGLTHLPVLTG